MGGYTAASSPSSLASEDEYNDGDADEDDGVSSSSTDEMSTWCTCPLSLVTKRGGSFGYESSHTHKGRVSIEDFC